MNEKPTVFPFGRLRSEYIFISDYLVFDIDFTGCRVVNKHESGCDLTNGFKRDLSYKDVLQAVISR